MSVKSIFYTLYIGVFFVACANDAPRSLSPIDIDAQLTQGRQLFMAHCAACHSPNMKTAVIGPALFGVGERRSAAFLYAYTRNSRAVRTSGDTAAQQLHQKYATEMPNFEQLRDDDLAAIYAFIASVYAGTRPLDSLRKAEMAK